MPRSRRLAFSALALLLLAGATLVWLLLTAAPLPALAIPTLLVLGALALTIGSRRVQRRLGDAVHIDLDRLRPGRLRDDSLRAAGYYRQIHALAETFPRPAVRAALIRDLPVAAATLRAVYDLCLVLQAYELGESQPPALAGVSPKKVAALVAGSEATINATLDALRQTYGTLRHAWSSPSSDAVLVGEPLADLVPLTAQLHDLAASFAPTRAATPTRPIS